jgi:lysozyme
VFRALEAEDLLCRDLREAEQAVESLVKAALSQFQFDALVSFVFNCGAGNFAASTLLRLLNDGNHRAAADQLLLWVHDHAGHRLAGLERRRRAERDLFLEGTT